MRKRPQITKLITYIGTNQISDGQTNPLLPPDEDDMPPSNIFLPWLFRTYDETDPLVSA